MLFALFPFCQLQPAVKMPVSLYTVVLWAIQILVVQIA